MVSREDLRRYMLDDHPSIDRDIVHSGNLTAITCRNAARMYQNALELERYINEDMANEDMMAGIHVQFKRQMLTTVAKTRELFETALEAMYTSILITEKCNCNDCRTIRQVDKLDKSVQQMFNAWLS